MGSADGLSNMSMLSYGSFENYGISGPEPATSKILRAVRTRSNPGLSKWFIDKKGNLLINPRRANYLRYLKAGSLLIWFLLEPLPAGNGSQINMRRIYELELKRQMTFIEIYGARGVPIPKGNTYELKYEPFSPDEPPPANGENQLFYIYETTRSVKGKSRTYYGITSQKGRGSAGRYPRNSEEGRNMKILGVAPYEVVRGLSRI